MSNFEKACRLRLRFSTNKSGSVSAEELWDLSYESLDELGMRLADTLEKETKGSLLGRKKVPGNTLNQLRYDIVKYIIETRESEDLAKQTARDEREAKDAKREAIKELIAKKQLDTLGAKSIEELIAELDALK